MKREAILSTIAAIGLALAGCDTGPSSPVDPGFPMDGDVGDGDGAETAIETFEGDWGIFAVKLPTTESAARDTVEGTCPGSVTLTTRTSSNGRIEVLAGSYVVLAELDCSGGSTMSGVLVDIDFRQDGGIDFGLDVPGSDGNMFEDFLVGSGLQFNQILPFGCSDPQPAGSAGEAKDELNHLDGTLLADRLRAAASASMKCPDGSQPIVLEDETGKQEIAQEATIQVKISVDLMRMP